MKRVVTKLDLMLSCPGDAYEVCYPAVKDAIDKINSDPQLNDFITIDLKHWITRSYPQSGGRAQKILNSQLVDDADMAIAVFWTRFGTPTDDYGSGTEEEIDLLIKNKKQVFLYFLDKPVPPSITGSPEYNDNRERIIRFQEDYDGLYNVVADENELHESIVKHLKLFLSKNNLHSDNHSNKWFRSDNGKEVLPSEVIKFGNITAQFDGSIARVEMDKTDGKTIYAEMDIKNNTVTNIVAEDYPQGYTLDIPVNLIISKRSSAALIHDTTYRVDCYLLKFNGRVQAIYDMNDLLQDITIQAPAGMTAFVDTSNNKICLIKKDDIKMP